MNTKTALLMFAIIAAFTLAAATLTVPLVHQAYAAKPTSGPSTCHEVVLNPGDTGTCARGTHGPPS
jgi:hypothetical protein